MHEDPAGIDNGAYGRRLRPVDMQKFGLLYLNGGCWEDQQLLPRDWVQLSFEPWIRSQPRLQSPDYGWYWWQRQWEGGWLAHIADGWKGQRIAVFPEQKIVLSMTAIMDSGEAAAFSEIVGRFATHLLDGRAAGDPTATELAAALNR